MAFNCTNKCTIALISAMSIAFIAGFVTAKKIQIIKKEI
jgi:hypothetical protein